MVNIDFELNWGTQELNPCLRYTAIAWLLVVSIFWTENVSGLQLDVQTGSVSKKDGAPPTPRLATKNRTVKSTHEFEKHGGITYTVNETEPLTCDVYVPAGEGPFPAILAVHGGAWRSGSKLHLAFHARHMASRGYVVVAINYRHAPSSKFPLQVHDCKQAVRWMRHNAINYKIDSTRIAGWGYSAGGNLVAMLGATDAEDGLEGEIPKGFADYSTRLQAVVSGGSPYEYSWADNRLLEFWLGASRSRNPQVYKRASPITYLDGEDPPFFIYHGTGDLLVPVSTAKKMKAKLDEAGIHSKLVIVEKRHLSTFNDFDRLDESLDFLHTVLTKTARKQVHRDKQ